MTVIQKRYEKKGSSLPYQYIFCCLIISIWTTLGSGCGKDETPPPPLKKKVVRTGQPGPSLEKTKIDVPADAKPDPLAGLKPEKEEPSLVFRIKSTRNPFKSFIQVKAHVPAGEPKKFLTPLQRYGLEQLKVVGILWSGRTSKALLEDDAGKGYVVSTGDAVGNRGGKVAAIKKDHIIIQEPSTDALGNSVANRIHKKLYPAEGGVNP